MMPRPSHVRPAPPRPVARAGRMSRSIAPPALAIHASIPHAIHPNVVFQTKDSDPNAMLWCNVPGQRGSRVVFFADVQIDSVRLSSFENKQKYSLGLCVDNLVPRTRELFNDIDNWAAGFLPATAAGDCKYKSLFNEPRTWINLGVEQSKYESFASDDGRLVAHMDTPILGILEFSIRGIWRMPSLGLWGLYLEIQSIKPAASPYEQLAFAHEPPINYAEQVTPDDAMEQAPAA